MLSSLNYMQFKNENLVLVCIGSLCCRKNRKVSLGMSLPRECLGRLVFRALFDFSEWGQTQD